MKLNLRASSFHAAVIAFANTAVQLASSFGVHLTASQDEAITGFMNAGLLLLSIAFIKSTNGNGAKV